ncbi:MAG: 30S ribosomal protein S8 [Candidatus Paceibacterota bacterium]
MDPIADMLIQIKNANTAGKPSVTIPYSKLKMAIAETLAKHGYISGADHKGSQPTKVIEIHMSQDEQGKSAIEGTNRISKVSRRVYEKSKNLRPVRHGYGHAVLSTPRGVMTAEEARKENVGGEILFTIW